MTKPSNHRAAGVATSWQSSIMAEKQMRVREKNFMGHNDDAEGHTTARGF